MAKHTKETLSDGHRDEIAQRMVATFVREMKSDVTIGHPWMGLSQTQQTDLAELMYAEVRPVVDELDVLAGMAIDLDEENAEAMTAAANPKRAKATKDKDDDDGGPK